MTVSIIIAVATWQKNLARCVSECLALDFSGFEIIVLPDAPLTPAANLECAAIPNPQKIDLRIIPSGCVSPAAKRDIGLGIAKGGILAFIDDDAYPRKDWLTAAVKNFQDTSVAAVGGPAVTPPEDTFFQRVSGLVYSSVMVSGNYAYRYIPARRREIEDYPSCNLLVKTSCLKELGGFSTKFWPGEDTKLCLEIIHILKKKIIYDPEVLIYHHRRKVFLPHLKQIASYALHRGYFVKKFPQTSLKPAYFVPSALVAFLALGTLCSLYSLPVRALFFFITSCYALCALISSVYSGLREKSSTLRLLQKPFLITLTFIGIIATHITYGIYFLAGICHGKLKEEL